MTIRDYARKHARLAKDHGFQVAIDSALNEVVAKTVFRPAVAMRQWQEKRALPAQRDRLEQLWDADQWTLIVFDAGRHDYCAPLLRDAYTGPVQPTFSDARDTFEWISKVWQGDHGDVTYVSGMVPVSDEIPDFDATDFKRYYDGINPGDSIGDIVKLWETDWDESVATVQPEVVTERALEYADRDKLVVHYNQPHSPFIGTPELLGHTNSQSAQPARGDPNDEPIWHRVRSGDVSDDYLRMAYWGNAARAIKAVKPLVQRRETVVATADHGEALGEWGMYTHDRAPHPKRRVVPWQRITGIRNDNGNATPESSLDDKLRALGYV